MDADDVRAAAITDDHGSVAAAASPAEVREVRVPDSKLRSLEESPSVF
jgi:hypothetical protein